MEAVHHHATTSSNHWFPLPANPSLPLPPAILINHPSRKLNVRWRPGCGHGERRVDRVHCRRDARGRRG